MTPQISDHPTPYHALGIQPSASEAEITTAYRSLARTLHPDKRPIEEHEDATREFQELQAAHDACIKLNEMPHLGVWEVWQCTTPQQYAYERKQAGKPESKGKASKPDLNWDPEINPAPKPKPVPKPRTKPFKRAEDKAENKSGTKANKKEEKRARRMQERKAENRADEHLRVDEEKALKKVEIQTGAVKHKQTRVKEMQATLERMAEIGSEEQQDEAEYRLEEAEQELEKAEDQLKEADEHLKEEQRKVAKTLEERAECARLMAEQSLTLIQKKKPTQSPKDIARQTKDKTPNNFSKDIFRQSNKHGELAVVSSNNRYTTAQKNSRIRNTTDVISHMVVDYNTWEKEHLDYKESRVTPTKHSWIAPAENEGDEEWVEDGKVGEDGELVSYSDTEPDDLPEDYSEENLNLPIWLSEREKRNLEMFQRMANEGSTGVHIG